MSLRSPCLFRWGIILGLTAVPLSGCGSSGSSPDQKPARPVALFEGLPLSGNQATAVAAGFRDCLDATMGVRCRREVTLFGVGPLHAAVDLSGAGPDGSARFDHVTLWHPSDQSAVLALEGALQSRGWASCLTKDAERFWHPPSPLRIAIDTSYWGHRRVVIAAAPREAEPFC